MLEARFRLGAPVRRRKVVVAGVVVLALLALSLVASSCGGTGGTGTTTAQSTPSTSGGAGGGAEVVMKNLAFTPASVTIKVGESVTWTNEDSTNHTVVADNGEFTSDQLANGATFSFTFDKAGTYLYHCSIHPSMKGTVIVQ